MQLLSVEVPHVEFKSFAPQEEAESCEFFPNFRSP